jgi:hypothetical protein
MELSLDPTARVRPSGEKLKTLIHLGCIDMNI